MPLLKTTFCFKQKTFNDPHSFDNDKKTIKCFFLSCPPLTSSPSACPSHWSVDSVLTSDLGNGSWLVPWLDCPWDQSGAWAGRQRTVRYRRALSRGAARPWPVGARAGRHPCRFLHSGSGHGILIPVPPPSFPSHLLI